MTELEREQYFQELYDKRYRTVLGFFYNRTKNLEVSQDLAQEAFINAWNGLPSLRNPSVMFSWFYRIAFNLLMNYFRENNRKEKIMLSFTFLDEEQWDRMLENYSIEASQEKQLDLNEFMNMYLKFMDKSPVRKKYIMAHMMGEERNNKYIQADRSAKNRLLPLLRSKFAKFKEVSS